MQDHQQGGEMNARRTKSRTNKRGSKPFKKMSGKEMATRKKAKRRRR